MKKPKPKPMKVMLDYHECAEYIAHKLGIKDLRNVAGKTFGNNDNTPYQDFWHFLLDHVEVHNGCEINIWPMMGGKGAEAWETKIVNAFIEEFGEDADYWVEW